MKISNRVKLAAKYMVAMHRNLRFAPHRSLVDRLYHYLLAQPEFFAIPTSKEGSGHDRC